MAFHGDFTSFPLPELLQWMDSSGKRGSLLLTWQAGERKLFLGEGRVVATASDGLWERIARLLAGGRLAKGELVLAAFAEMRRTGDAQTAFGARKIELALPVTLASEELYGTLADLTTTLEGEFHWSEDSDRSDDEWVPMDLSLRQLLFEALRWVDEQPDVEKALPSDSVIVRACMKPTPDLPLLHQIILALTEKELSLGKLRLALGVSRSAAMRRVFDLLRQQLVEVEGAPDIHEDPIVQMLEKGTVLVRESQFEAARLVCSTLLASDPSDRRVREFARMVEREHVAALYSELPPLQVPELVSESEGLSLLRPEERHVASLVNGSWDVSTIVLASQSRELDTLKALSKMRRLGLLRSSL
jgi:hypothetical protein